MSGRRLYGVRLLSLIALFVLGIPVMSGAEEAPEKKLFFTPINPAFVKYADSLKDAAPEARGAALRAAEDPLAPPTYDLSHIKASSYANFLSRNGDALPAKFDLREQGRLTPVRNQNPFGTCWSFATLGSMESAYKKRYGKDIDLSEAHLAWYAYAEEPGWDIDLDENVFETGGYPQASNAILARGVGPVSEFDAPYGHPLVGSSANYANVLSLRETALLTSFAAARYDLGLEETALPPAEVLKSILMERGGIVVCYMHDDDRLNPATFGYYRPEGLDDDAGGHAVMIAGWDDDFPRGSFNADYRPKGDGAWLIRNSWGTGFADGGYFWMSYENSPMMGTAQYYPEKAEAGRHVYSYDPMGWIASAGPESGGLTGWMANIFTADEDETLVSAGFYTTEPDAGYEIYVYTDVQSSDPTSGDLRPAAVTRGRIDFAGYHVVDLAGSVSLSKGQTFSIVVKLTNPSHDAMIAVEYPSDILGSTRVSPLTGQGFIGENGTTWQDMAEEDWEIDLGELGDEEGTGVNVCLKAITRRAAAASQTPIVINADASVTDPDDPEKVTFTLDLLDPEVVRSYTFKSYVLVEGQPKSATRSSTTPSIVWDYAGLRSHLAGTALPMSVIVEPRSGMAGDQKVVSLNAPAMGAGATNNSSGSSGCNAGLGLAAAVMIALSCGLAAEKRRQQTRRN